MSTFTPSAEQAAIIDAPVDADVLVVAGAGSGKTFTMTQRIIALINRGVAPERILGLTFTRKAAGELLERVSAAVAGDMAGSTTATVSDRAFLKPAIFTYDAFFQTIVRQYGLLVGFDQNTQPLSAAGALQLATEVIDSHMDLAFSEDFGAFSSLANRVLALSDAIGSAMIGAGCTSFDDAINRVRQWDSAFINRLQQAVADEPMPEDEPKIPKIKRLKKDTDASWQAKLDDRAEHLHARCTYHCGALLETTRKRDILLQLVEAYAQAKRERNMAEFSDFTIAAYQLIERFPPSESVRAAGTATCCSTNIRTPPPRRPLCWQHCSTWMRHRGPPSTRWVIRSSRFTHGVVPALVHSVCSSKISTCLPDTSHSRCPSPGETAV